MPSASRQIHLEPSPHPAARRFCDALGCSDSGATIEASDATQTISRVAAVLYELGVRVLTPAERNRVVRAALDDARALIS